MKRAPEKSDLSSSCSLVGDVAPAHSVDTYFELSQLVLCKEKHRFLKLCWTRPKVTCLFLRLVIEILVYLESIVE